MSEHCLSEIVIERPRHGMRCSSRRLKGVRKELDRLTEVASEDGLLSPYLIKTRHKTKSLADHLGPLRRLLRSKVNQPWNEVYHELCQRLDSSTLTGQHVISHLWNYVEKHVELIEGIPYRKVAFYRNRRLGSGYHDEFYIHPDTGLLCLAERSPKPVPPKLTDRIVIDDYHQYRKLDDVWYLITFADLPIYTLCWDVLLKTAITPDIAYRKYGRLIYASRKIQCNKRLLKVVYARLA
jgi:hypothetical protein